MKNNVLELMKNFLSDSKKESEKAKEEDSDRITCGNALISSEKYGK